jgi:hypothetical protein
MKKKRGLKRAWSRAWILFHSALWRAGEWILSWAVCNLSYWQH